MSPVIEQQSPILLPQKWRVGMDQRYETVKYPWGMNSFYPYGYLSVIHFLNVLEWINIVHLNIEPLKYQ